MHVAHPVHLRGTIREAGGSDCAPKKRAENGGPSGDKGQRHIFDDLPHCIESDAREAGRATDSGWGKLHVALLHAHGLG